MNVAVMSGAAQVNLLKADTVFTMVKGLLAGTPLAGQSTNLVAAAAVVLTVAFLTSFPKRPRATSGRVW